jgi:formyl-CoA transferase
MYAASLDLQAYLTMGGEGFLQPASRLDRGNPMSGTLYPSKDGRWVTLTMPDTERWWPSFAQVVGLDVADPRFDSHEKRCGESRLEMMAVLEAAFQQQTGAYWRERFDEKQLSADIIEAYEHPVQDEQVLRNRYIVELEHPSLGRLKTLGFPIHLSEGTAHLDRWAPARGQHTAEILQGLLGYSDARVDELRTASVIL